MPQFDSEFLKKLEYLSLVSKRVFHGQLLAQKRAKQLGSGVEFADHRDYAAGDDVRYLDWNVYARHGDLLIKRFQEEQDLHVYIFLDCSRSMQFGTPSKFDYARQVAAALAYIALADFDRVSVVAYSDRIVDTFPLIRGKDRILTLIDFLQGLSTQGQDTNLKDAALSFVQQKRRRGLAIVISDLFDPHGFQPGIDLLRHRRHELHLVQVYDKSESHPQRLGDVELVDVETDRIKRVTVTERSLQQYQQVFASYLQSVTEYASRCGLGCTQTTTEIPFDDLILRMMRSAGALS